MILLIGGNGFLGRHLTDLLGKLGHDVTVVTRTADVTGTYKGTRRLVLASALTSEEGFREVVGRAQVVVYLASVSVPSTFADVPWQEVNANVAPALHFFSRCAQVNPELKIVLISSGGTIYGHSGDKAVTEEMPVKPTSAYGLGKLMIEDGLSFVGRVYGLTFHILRVSNPVGKWQSSEVQGVVPAILRSMQTGEPFKVFGDGQQVRDYVDADEVARAMYASIIDSQYVDRIWNVGSGIGRSVVDVVRTVEAVTGKRVELEYCPPRKSDIQSIVLDCNRIERELGWRSKSDLEASVTKMLGVGLGL